MGKIAFVFSGQGAQYSGMGQELYKDSEAARDVFDSLEKLRPGTLDCCFSGSEEELSETKNTQPCMFAVELAAAAAAEETGIHADMAAGFSLGEIAALTYSKAANMETGFRLVCKRGELMQQAALAAPASMAAVLRLSNEKVEEICAGFDKMYPVNYNCPGQVSVAGAQEEMQAFFATVKEAGGRAVPLKVKGGFHSPFMAEASEKFAGILESAELSTPEVTLYSNCTGLPYDGDMRELLAKQICSPVRWEAIVRHMISSGADTFIEMGPGKTLCGLISRIDPAVRVFSLSDKVGLETVTAEVKNA